MPFIKTKLQQDFIDLFNSMNSDDETVFPKGFSDTVVAYVSSGVVSTNDSGAITGGSYQGTGTGTLSVTATACSKIIEDACKEMHNLKDESNPPLKGNNYLAEKIGEAIKKMSDDGTVTTTVTGTLTPPSSAPITPYVGTAKGTIKCNSTALVTALKNIFQEMWNKKSEDDYDGNLELAKCLSDEIDSYWKNGSISTNGQGNISGSKGSGSIS